MKVLDYGCGDGGFDEIDPYTRKHFVSWLKEYGGEGSVGLDIDWFSLSIAREKIKNGTKFWQNDGETIPFPNNYFDQVHIFGVLHHAKHPLQVMIELKRVLKPGGEIILTESVDNYLPTRIARHLYGRWKDMEITNYFNSEELVKWTDSLFEVKEVKHCWHPLAMEPLRMYNKDPEFLLPVWEWFSKGLRKIGWAENFCCHCVVRGYKP